MASKIELIVLNGLNYIIWETNMEMFLKSKGLWQYTKVLILDPSNAQENFVINGNKDEVVWQYMKVSIPNLSNAQGKFAIKGKKDEVVQSLPPISHVRYGFIPVESIVLMNV